MREDGIANQSVTASRNSLSSARWSLARSGRLRGGSTTHDTSWSTVHQRLLPVFKAGGLAPTYKSHSPSPQTEPPPATMIQLHAGRGVGFFFCRGNLDCARRVPAQQESNLTRDSAFGHPETHRTSVFEGPDDEAGPKATCGGMFRMASKSPFLRDRQAGTKKGR